MFLMVAGKWRKGERKVVYFVLFAELMFCAVPRDGKLGFSV